MSERELKWDEPAINEPSESNFNILPPGNYPFRVVSFQRARHQQTTGKLPDCPKAIVKIEIYGGDAGNATVDHNLFLYSTQEGLLCQFFAAIGHRKHGDPLVMEWNRVPGSQGWCKVRNKQGQKNPDMTFNEIDRFIDPPDTSKPEPETPLAAEFSFG